MCFYNNSVFIFRSEKTLTTEHQLVIMGYSKLYFIICFHCLIQK